jgi:hypothetical protein
MRSVSDGGGALLVALHHGLQQQPWIWQVRHERGKFEGKIKEGGS